MNRYIFIQKVKEFAEKSSTYVKTLFTFVRKRDVYAKSTRIHIPHIPHTSRTISPKIKQIMINRLTNAIDHIKRVDTIEELAALDNSEYDRDNGTMSVTIYSNRTDR